MRNARFKPSPALVLGFVALLVALGSTAKGDEPRAASAAKANLKVVKADFSVSNGEVRDGSAKCPSGTKVLTGGYASTGQHAKIFVSGPARVDNGYIVYALVPPVNINAGVTKETAKITIVAYCAPVGRPLVVG